MTSTPCILLTGFEPFGGESVNPSWEVAQALAGEMMGLLRVESVQLPCVFAQAPQALETALAQYSPRAVLCLGQAEGRSEVTPERVAINMIQARIPDNAGAQRADCLFLGSAAFPHGQSTAPLQHSCLHLQQRGHLCLQPGVLLASAHLGQV
jgi:pyroglutamyl-peptidase